MRAHTLPSRMTDLSRPALWGGVALLALGAVSASAQTLPRGVYIVPAGGYSVDVCLATSAECGRVVANAWCEANGHGKARAFGSASDVTFSSGVEVKAPPRDSVMIACSD
ncbi:MAG: hypothetical protein ACK4MV_20230 [Beijerinckiaceae bacterium]